MKKYIIRLKDHEESESLANKCLESYYSRHSDRNIEYFDAVTPDQNEKIMNSEFPILEWNYPWQGSVTDMATGLTKRAYLTANPGSRIACALSHYILWKNCLKENIPYLILEHDAIFIDSINLNILKTKFDIISINDPRRATRKSQEYYDKIKASPGNVIPVPIIDTFDVPQGLPGNSAYIIKPEGAKHMLKLVKDYGLWPNDALMCRQLVPNLGVSTNFFTMVQLNKSTTTL
tara:strand:- start:1398 stop:2096 length:699 start_codon:yes stop_codon:yes gene_type:complete